MTDQNGINQYCLSFQFRPRNKNGSSSGSSGVAQARQHFATPDNSRNDAVHMWSVPVWTVQQDDSRRGESRPHERTSGSHGLQSHWQQAVHQQVS